MACRRIGVAVPGLASGTVVRLGAEPALSRRAGSGAACFPASTVALGNDAQLALLAEAALGRGARALATPSCLPSARASARPCSRMGGSCAGESGAAAVVRLGLRRPGGSRRRRRSAGSNATPRGRRSTRIAGALGLADGRGADRRGARGRRARARRRWRSPAAALGAALAGAVALLGSQSRDRVRAASPTAIDVLAPLILPSSSAICRPICATSTLAPAQFGASASLVGAGLAAQGHPLWAGQRSMTLPIRVVRPDRNRPEPLWHQTERALRALIADGDLARRRAAPQRSPALRDARASAASPCATRCATSRSGACCGASRAAAPSCAAPPSSPACAVRRASRRRWRIAGLTVGIAGSRTESRVAADNADRLGA